MAMGFAADGWSVSGCGTDAAALQSLASELGPNHHLQPCDVTDPAAVEEFAAAGAVITALLHICHQILDVCL